MPLPNSKNERQLLHARNIECRGYQRCDGLWDIEGWITDIKTYNFDNLDRRGIKAGEPLHGMGLRITIDDSLTIQECIAVTDYSPFKICPNITPNFQKLAGLKIGPGFSRKASELIGGVKGCTHLFELLKPIATTAFQTLVGKNSKKIRSMIKPEKTRKPPMIDTCHAWASDGEIVKRELKKFLDQP